MLMIGSRPVDRCAGMQERAAIESAEIETSQHKASYRTAAPSIPVGVLWRLDDGQRDRR
jgi:hypothetical protein